MQSPTRLGEREFAWSTRQRWSCQLLFRGGYDGCSGHHRVGVETDRVDAELDESAGHLRKIRGGLATDPDVPSAAMCPFNCLLNPGTFGSRQVIVSDPMLV